MSNQETGVAWEFIKRAILPTRPVYRVIVGVAAFFGGLILATYAFGDGNPDPKTAKDF